MRIIAGEWRRRQLRAPPGDATRPSADRTRETLFSMLASRLGTFEGLSVADLFAGSGALGLEALSRGAATCLFVEEEPKAIQALGENISRLDAKVRCSVQAISVLKLGPARSPIDLVLLDPPYSTNLGAVAIDRLVRLGWIGPASWVALETGRSDEVSVRALRLEAERKVGNAVLRLFRSPEDRG